MTTPHLPWIVLSNWIISNTQGFGLSLSAQQRQPAIILLDCGGTGLGMAKMCMQENSTLNTKGRLN